MADKEGLEGLRRRARDLGAQRRAAEREVVEGATVRAALAMVRRDLEERSSPQLRQAQRRLEDLRDRLVDARNGADHTARLLTMLVDAAGPECTEVGADEVRDLIADVEMSELRAKLAALRAQRKLTDATGGPDAG